jgi:vancomycin resistance protein YoaR
VKNIQRGAEIMDGTIVRPGERFSLNEVLGKRTVERGFVEAPQIYAGRLEDAVGGGVSQIATTTYNAAFFAGVQIVTHQPHEFYISRYPMGREATVSWGGPELVWRNDWPAAILVKAYADSDSITVQLYSTKLRRRVETETAEPTQFTAPRTITVSNPSLPPGTTRVVQSAGPSGFLISYTRKVYEGTKLRRNERYVWRYKPENAIVEVGPRKPRVTKPEKSETEEPEPETTPDGGPSGTG